MDLAVHVVGDHVVPVGEAVVEFLDVLLALGDLLFILLPLALVFLFDARGSAWRSGFGGSLAGWSLLGGRGAVGLAGLGRLVRGLGGALPASLFAAPVFASAVLASLFALPAFSSLAGNAEAP